jgi:hypothetical protein
MGEGFKPELVTVQPLTRGQETITVQLYLRLLVDQQVRPIEIHLHNEIGGREFQRVVKKVALEDI